jgi:hypothetical protein
VDPKDWSIFAGVQLFSHLRPDQLVEAHKWARSALPPRDRIEVGVVHSPDPVTEFAGGLVSQLMNRSSDDAADQLEILAVEIDTPHLRSQAQTIRAGTWTPYPLDELKDLLANDRHRPIETEEQLAAAVVAALHVIQEQLNAKAPVRRNFWDLVPASQPSGEGKERAKKKPVYRPRGENEASDQLKLLLERELGQMVVLHREVQVQPRLGGQPGQRTDLLVTVIGPNGRVHCTVEVKGSWNDEVGTALPGQLVDRYLQGSEGRTGIYLVLHFVRDPSWDSEDARRRRRFDEAKTCDLLHTQAAEAADRATVHPFILRIALDLNTPDDDANQRPE